MSQYIEKAEKATLPTLPLRGIVAFPNGLLNFELSDEDDVRAAEAAANSNSPIFLVAKRPSPATARDAATDDLLAMLEDAENAEESDLREPLAEEKPVGKPQPVYRRDIYRVGTVARIKQLVRSPEGQVRLIVEGQSRAVLRKIIPEQSYLTCEVMVKSFLLCDVTGVEAQAHLHALQEALRALCRFLPTPAEELLKTAAALPDPGVLADFIAANVLIRHEDKQAVLECFEPLDRAQTLLAILSEEEQLLALASDIQGKVQAGLTKNQKEYYLREQLRVIQEELGEGSAAEVNRYVQRIHALHLDPDSEKKLIKETDRLSRTPYGSPEASVITGYLDTVLELPWGKKTRDRVDLAAAKKILDEDHDGLEKVKERILEYLAVKKLHPELRNQVLCLVGAPGVGKTSVAASIARAMKRKYVRVSLGGIRDESDIRGHRKTYIGSMPGRIMAALRQAGTSNPLILLDEIDKMTQSAQGDPASALLEVLDGEQNKTFRDHFIEIPFDLSDCIFIATANTLETVPHPLIDRMEIIEMHIYTKREKIGIAKNHLIPKQIRTHGLTRAKFRISDEALVEVIDYYTHEAGVRNLERTIAALVRKAARKMVEENRKHIYLETTDIKDYLGPRKLYPEKVGEEDEIGTVNGLAYTELGGDMLQVEVAVLDGTGKLELTGSLGDVMKESAKTALTCARALAPEYRIASDFYQKKDIHIHVPEGAVPKDGPSAGVTMLTALVSALSGRPVRHDVAMTGEITLRGRVLPIGGLREKTMAAYSAGVKTVLIPAENERDLADIDPLARDNLTFIPCRTAGDVLRGALR